MYEATSKWHCTGRWIFYGCIGGHQVWRKQVVLGGWVWKCDCIEFANNAQSLKPTASCTHTEQAAKDLGRTTKRLGGDPSR